MEQKGIAGREKLTSLQMELSKGLRYITSENQLEEIRRMLSDYFAQQLNETIERVEKAKQNTAGA